VAQTQGVPCAATNDPWEAWYSGLGGNPAQPTAKFEYCTLFFFGLQQLIECFIAMWKRMPSGSTAVACQWPNDADGTVFRAVLTPVINGAGFKVVDGGPYIDGLTDFTAMINKFKGAGCQYISNCPLPPDFNIFWKQANQLGWKPKLATVAKVLLFPNDLTALGPLVNNIATDSWWGPYMPYRSSLDDKLRAQDLVNLFQAQTGREWVQSIGGTYSLFEIAHQALTAVSDPHDHPEVAAALHNVNYHGISGRLDFASGHPAPGVVAIPVVGVQWKETPGKFPFEMRVVDNTLNPIVKLGAHLTPTNP